MDNSIFFSIIIPTYNRADFIGKTISSLINQTYTNFELIVVDDGSTDNTDTIIAQIEDPRIQYVKKENGERAAARNFGAALAKGDYVNFFDSDDIALPNHLEEAASLVKRLQEVPWFHLGYSWADADGKVFQDVNKFTGETLNPIMYKGNSLSCNGVFVRRDIILKNRFNEDRILSASEDYELWCRLTARYPLYYSNTITSLVIDHDLRSVRTINGKKLIERINALNKYLEADTVTKEYFGEKFNIIKMDSDSYIALILANKAEYKLKSISYLFKALFKSVSLLADKRFYATIKNLIIKW